MECYVCPHRCGVDRPADMHAEGIFGSCHARATAALSPLLPAPPCTFGKNPASAAKKAAAQYFSAAATCTAFFARTTKSAA